MRSCGCSGGGVIGCRLTRPRRGRSGSALGGDFLLAEAMSVLPVPSNGPPTNDRNPDSNVRILPFGRQG